MFFFFWLIPQRCVHFHPELDILGCSAVWRCSDWTVCGFVIYLYLLRNSAFSDMLRTLLLIRYFLGIVYPGIGFGVRALVLWTLVVMSVLWGVASRLELPPETNPAETTSKRLSLRRIPTSRKRSWICEIVAAKYGNTAVSRLSDRGAVSMFLFCTLDTSTVLRSLSGILGRQFWVLLCSWNTVRASLFSWYRKIFGVRAFDLVNVDGYISPVRNCFKTGITVWDKFCWNTFEAAKPEENTCSKKRLFNCEMLATNYGNTVSRSEWSWGWYFFSFCINTISTSPVVVLCPDEDWM